MKISALFCCISIFASFQLNATAAEFNTWEMYQGNAQHTGFVPITIAANRIKKTWQSNAADSSSVNYKISQAVIGDNAIYVSRTSYNNANTLLALSIDSGNTLWKTEFGKLEAQPPAYHNGKIFIQTLGYYTRDKGRFQAFNEKGQLFFTTIVSDTFGRSVGAPIISNGIIYTENGDGSVISYREKNGDELKEYIGYESYYIAHSPAIVDNFLVEYSDDSMRIYEVDSAQLIAQIPLVADTGFIKNPTPVICDNQSFLIYRKDQLFKINITKQEMEYSIPDVKGFPAVDNENIYTVKNARLTAIDKLSGKTKWMAHGLVFDKAVRNIIVTNNLVFVSDERSTSAISKESHKRLWKTSIHGEISLSKKGLIIVSRDGQLTRFSITTKNDEFQPAR